MKENELRERLKALYPDVPVETHAAFMQAAASEREQPVMKQKLRFSPVLAILIVLMLTAAAYAVSTYSVRDLDEFKKNPEHLENHLLDIGQRFENDSIAISVNDTTFDGLHYAVALNMEHKKPGEYVFVRPKLVAESEGVTFWANVENSTKYDFRLGFLFPDPRTPSLASDVAAFDGTLMSQAEPVMLAPAGPAHWTLTLDVYRMNFKPVTTSVYLDGYLTFAEERARWLQWRALCRNAYRHKQIYVNTYGGICDLETYMQFFPSSEEIYNQPLAEQMVDAGIMEKVDTIVCEWTTDFGMEARQKELLGQRLHYDIYNGYDLVLDEFNVTYRQVNCEMHMAFDKPLSKDSLFQVCGWIPHHWEGRVNGSPDAAQTVDSRAVAEERDVDGSGETQWVLRCITNMTLNEEARTVEFVPYEENWDATRAYYPELGFTVDLAAGTITRNSDASGTLCPPKKWGSPPPQASVTTPTPNPTQ